VRNLGDLSIGKQSDQSFPVSQHSLSHTIRVGLATFVIFIDIAAGAFLPRSPFIGFIFPAYGGRSSLHQRVTERLADLVTPALVPEIVTLVGVRTRLVLTVKLAAVAPGARVTLDGTVATVGLLLESWTVTPVEGAAPLRVTVPVDGLPPTTFDGFNFNEDNAGGATVNVAVFVTPL